MYQAQVNEYKYEISRLMREMGEAKKMYFQIKRKEQLNREDSMRGSVRAGVVNGSQPKFTGGGFSLATHA